MFVTVCYFNCKEMFLFTRRDEGGGGELGPLLLFNPLWVEASKEKEYFWEKKANLISVNFILRIDLPKSSLAK